MFEHLMMDKYHQEYWANDFRIRTSKCGEDMSEHEIQMATHYATEETHGNKYRSREE